MESYLQIIYHDPGHLASFPGPTKLYTVKWLRENTKYCPTKTKVKSWLEGRHDVETSFYKDQVEHLITYLILIEGGHACKFW